MDSPVIQVIANALSTVTILSCLLLKVPQIMYIREKKSSKGIYVQAMLMEISGFTIVTLYNFTNRYGVLTYLEYPIILIQIYVMMYYVLKYNNILKSRLVSFATLTYVMSVIGFGMEIFPKDILAYIVPFCTPLSGFAKVTYMYGIIRTGNADAVSITTWVISVLTNLSRLFTVYVDSSDSKLMVNFLVSSILSSGVLITALIYKTSGPPTPAPTRRVSRASGRRHSHFD